MRGVFNLRPPIPRYEEIWDVRIVLNYLRQLSPAKDLPLKSLTLKVCMLVALVSGQRVQTLKKLRIDSLTIKASSIIICVKDLLKQSRPGNTGCVVKLLAYPPERKLCVYTYLKQYLSQTKLLRGSEKQLFVSYKRPHNPVSTDTLARWLKVVMSAAGLNTDIYKAHSTRSASTSAANEMQIPVEDILKAAGWKSEETFRKFYKKPIRKEDTFANAVLRK